MINSKIFTEDEKAILRSLPSRFEWIARDADGTLCIYKDMPKRKGIEFICSDPNNEFAGMEIFEHIFKGVTFENSPIRFMDEVLDEVERAYLKAVLRPFKKKNCLYKKAERRTWRTTVHPRYIRK